MTCHSMVSSEALQRLVDFPPQAASIESPAVDENSILILPVFQPSEKTLQSGYRTETLELSRQGCCRQVGDPRDSSITQDVDEGAADFLFFGPADYPESSRDPIQSRVSIDTG